MPSTTQDYGRTGGGAGFVTAAPTCVCAGLSRWRLFTLQMEARRSALLYMYFFSIRGETAATGGNVQVGVKEMENLLHKHPDRSLKLTSFVFIRI